MCVLKCVLKGGKARARPTHTPWLLQLPRPVVCAVCRFFWKGSLAYVGGDRAIMDVPGVGAITGPEVGLAWKGYETIAQISPRNAMLVLQNFVRTKLFGRDLSQL